MTQSKPFLVVLFMAIIIVLSACAENGISTNTPVPSNTPLLFDTQVSSETPQPHKPAIDYGTYQQNAYVESIEINIMESFPLQVSVTLQGNLPDGCTTLAGSKAVKTDETTFEVFIYTLRDPKAICTMALVPFEETVPLNVSGLPAGTYTVKAYNLSDTFTFEQNN